MQPAQRPQAPIQKALGELRHDAKSWLETVQTAAQRLKVSLRSDKPAPEKQKDSPRKKPLPADIGRALDDYQRHEDSLLETHHSSLRSELATIAGPLDELLARLAREHIRTGVTAANEVILADAARDWLRKLYVLETMEEAMYSFHRAEVCYRATRMGLDLLCTPQRIAELEARANKLNRDGVNAIFHLRDHLMEQREALEDKFDLFEERLADPQTESVLGRAALAHAFTRVLGGDQLSEDEREAIERRLEALPLPPGEDGLDGAMELLVELAELIGAQRQSRDRGWFPDDPTRSVDAVAVSFWLLYTQISTNMFFAVCLDARGAVDVDAQRITESLRRGLLELLAHWIGHVEEVQRRLSIHP